MAGDRETISDELIDLSPPGVEANSGYRETDFYRCKFMHTGDWPYFLFNCNFVDCHFEWRKVGGRQLSSDCRFEHCVFDFVKGSQFMFNDGHEFHSCTFTGTLRDSVFGLDPTSEYSKGAVVDCNFEDLKFDQLSFRGTTFATGLSLPDWPIIRLHKGARFDSGYSRDQLPIELRYYDFGHSSRHEQFSAIDLRTVLKDPEELWTAAYDAPFMDFNNKSAKKLPTKSAVTKVRAVNKRHHHSHDKYRKAFLSLIRTASILEIRRQNKDVVLSMAVKDDDNPDVERFIIMTLIDCSRVEFVDGDNDGNAEGYKKKFFLTGMDVNERTDTLILKGPRKKMGRLHLTFADATIELT